MTTATAHPGTTVSLKAGALALAGLAVAAGAGFGIAAVVLDDPAVLGTSVVGTNDDTTNDIDRYPGFDPDGFAGTDREERSFQHRR
jgi:hypothetical protein